MRLKNNGSIIRVYEGGHTMLSFKLLNFKTRAYKISKISISQSIRVSYQDTELSFHAGNKNVPKTIQSPLKTADLTANLPESIPG